MIIIISEHIDFSTNNVINWLRLYKKAVIRINPKDTLNIEFSNELSNNNIDSSIQLDKLKIKSTDINTIWYRRGYFINRFNLASLQETNHLQKKKELKFLQTEKQNLIDFFNLNISESQKLGAYDKYEVNKLNVLKLAIKNKIKIPSTIITTQKTEVIEFHKKMKENIITKPILDGINQQIKNVQLNMFTSKVDDTYINNLPNTFFETCFQENIEKKFELRIFFLKSKFYAMAIFSQNDMQTAIDFRQYNSNNPNRNVPFKLPDNLKKSLTKLMCDIGLNTGSIDMIYTKDKEYVFLEVNPVGQFKMTSMPCNYYIERDVARIL